VIYVNGIKNGNIRYWKNFNSVNKNGNKKIEKNGNETETFETETDKLGYIHFVSIVFLF